MKGMRLGPNFTLFALFFGVATFEAFLTRNWFTVAFWLAISLVFLATDNLRREDKQGALISGKTK